MPRTMPRHKKKNNGSEKNCYLYSFFILFKEHKNDKTKNIEINTIICDFKNEFWNKINLK